MARINIEIEPGNDLKVKEVSTILTECATIYELSIEAKQNDLINIELIPDTIIDYFFLNGVIILSSGAINSHIIVNGVRQDFINNVSLLFDYPITLKFTIENSGIAGFFNNVNLVVSNLTTSETFNKYENKFTRLNDSEKCGECCNGGTSTNSLGLHLPQLFNPNSGEVTAGTISVTLLYLTDVGLVSINGLVLDDSEYSLVGTILTITPDNGFDDIDDEILVFQNKQ